ncbi:MAG: hypothetical protein LQ348_002630 [Seirophora lacunosa]|nr:MAG: hypothetical protein LQ348_002630 [Seirophora lacunosa]
MPHFTHTNTPHSLPNHEADFVLYPSETSETTPHSTAARRIIEPSTVTSRTHPSQPYLGSPSVNTYQRRHTQQPTISSTASAVSPMQNRRVSDIIQATGLSTLAHPPRSPSNGQTMRSNRHNLPSAPSWTTPSPALSRPPVPRFSQSTGDIPQQPDMTLFEGTAFRCSLVSLLSLTSFPSDELSMWGENPFGPPAGFDMTGTSVDGAYIDPFPQSPLPMAHSLSAESQTISPADMHKPSPSTSGVMTCQSTPQTDLYDSPYAFSQKTSPNWPSTESPYAVFNSTDFDELPLGRQMFPDLDGQDNEEIIPTSIEKTPVPASRKGSSPGKASSNVRLSLINGINKTKKRKEPLPEIELKSNDPKEVKKARNTLAARKSRDRKEERTKLLVEECEKRADEAEALRQELETWKDRAYRAGWQPDDE